MDTIEQILTAAKITATTDEQKKRVSFASIIYDMAKQQSLQRYVEQLQHILQNGCVSLTQRDFITHSINDAMSEISRINASLNNECIEQIADFLTPKRI